MLQHLRKYLKEAKEFMVFLNGTLEKINTYVGYV